jgi:hypothetical protein
MDLGLAEGDADPEEGAFAIGPAAPGNEDGAVEDLAALAGFFMAGIQKDAAAELLDDAFGKTGAPWSVNS